MKKKNKGFTLIELLAVIIVLGILLSVVGSRALKTKKKANASELQKQAKMLADLAPGIYSNEKIMNPSGDFMKQYKLNQSFYIDQDSLVDAGYLDGKIKSPYTGKDCDYAQVIFTWNTSNSEYTYDSYIKCDGGKNFEGTPSSSSKVAYDKDSKIFTTKP